MRVVKTIEVSHQTQEAEEEGEPSIADLCKPISAKVMPKSAQMKYIGGYGEKTEAEMLAEQRKQVGSTRARWKATG